MTSFKSWRRMSRRINAYSERGKCGFKIRQLPYLVIYSALLYIIFRTTWNQQEFELKSRMLRGLPRGIVHAQSDLEKHPLWGNDNPGSKVNASRRYLLAIPAGIKQKHNVNTMVEKFLPENFTIILFHYDGNVNEWRDLRWNDDAIHVVARNQTKWWYAKRFLHPDIVSLYDYIFLWDEDLGVKNFHPRSYLWIVRKHGFDISQPALDPKSTGIHHRLTVKSRRKKFHKGVYNIRGQTKCSRHSKGPPCTGFVEGMAPVFSRSAWLCTWHLIQNDLVHGWGVDVKLGYCVQGDRTEKIAIIDQEYVIHQGIQTLGGVELSVEKTPDHGNLNKRKHATEIRDMIRRQSHRELQVFKERWSRSVENDTRWVDPYKPNLADSLRIWLDMMLKRRQRKSKGKVK